MQRITPQEERMWRLTAVGLSAKEVADKLCVSTFTVQNTLYNIKEKVGLQKATELVASYLCREFGVCFIEFRKKVLAGSLAVLAFFSSVSIDDTKAITRRIRVKRQEYEYVLAA